MSVCAPLRVLHLDDDRDDRLLIGEALERAGIEVVGVADPPSALAHVGEKPFDAIFVDHQLVGTTGLSVLEDLRGSGFERAIIYLTGHDDGPLDIQSFEAGADEYLSKTRANPESLLRALRWAMERARLRQELKAQQAATLAAMHAAVESKERFLAHVSHELRTPLTAILGLSELLLHGLPVGPLRELSGTIHTSGQSMLAIVNDLLDAAQLNAGQFRLQLGDVDLSAMGRHLNSLFAPTATARGLELALVMPNETVRTDGLRLQQVLTNLISNAVKYTDVGRVDVVVRLEPVDQQLWLLGEVRDTGPGMSAAMLARLPLAFERGEHGNIPGAGLGLPITRELVELMDGALTLRSEQGTGTVVSFRVRVEPTARAVASESETQAMSVQDARRVLVVDDNKTNLLVLKRLFEHTGCMVTVASGGAEALELATETSFDVVISDQLMPDMTGIELAKTLQQTVSWSRHVPIWILTAHLIDPAFERRCRQAGCEGALSKPISMQGVQDIVRSSVLSEG